MDEVLGLLFGNRGTVLVERQRRTENRGERGTQVVGDSLEERVLHLVERLKPLRGLPFDRQGSLQPLLRPLDLGDVEQGPLPELRLAIVATNEERVLADPDRAPAL